MSNEETRIARQPAAPIITVTPTGSLTPGNFEGLWRLSQIMAASGFMPKGMTTVESVFVAVQMGLEVGLSPMQAVQNIAPINGRPSIWGDAALGLVQASGLLEDFAETVTGTPMTDDWTATATAKRRGWKQIIVRSFSFGDAKKAGLVGKAGPWSQYPARMLQMRARGFCLRDGFADVLKGIVTREEAMDTVEISHSIITDGDGAIVSEVGQAATASTVDSLRNRLAAAKESAPESPVEIPADPPKQRKTKQAPQPERSEAYRRLYSEAAKHAPTQSETSVREVMRMALESSGNGRDIDAADDDQLSLAMDWIEANL